MKPVTRVHIRDSILEVELETTAYMPIDDMIAKAESLVSRLKGSPVDAEADA